MLNHLLVFHNVPCLEVVCRQTGWLRKSAMRCPPKKPAKLNSLKSSTFGYFRYFDISTISTSSSCLNPWIFLLSSQLFRLEKEANMGELCESYHREAVLSPAKAVISPLFTSKILITMVKYADLSMSLQNNYMKNLEQTSQFLSLSMARIEDPLVMWDPDRLIAIDADISCRNSISALQKFMQTATLIHSSP